MPSSHTLCGILRSPRSATFVRGEPPLRFRHRGGMWKQLMFWRRTPAVYMSLEEASRELAKVCPPLRGGPAASPSSISDSERVMASRSRRGLPGGALRHPPIPSQAETKRSEVSPVLRGLLLNGTLLGYFQNESGQVAQLPPEFWAEAPAVELTETQRLTGKYVEYQLSGKVMVLREQISVLLKLVANFGSQQGRNSRSRGQGGAPPKYDSEAFLTEAFRILYESNPAPRSPADLRRRALDAYVEAGHPGGAPSEDWARPKILKLWKRLRSE
jgi:hypothetical protein